MGDINSKFSFCPRCGKKLLKVKYTAMDVYYYMCIDGACRTTIRDSVVDTMSVDNFSRVCDKLNIRKEESNTFMLLKENLSGPMLQKISNNCLEKDKSLYCIVQAKDKEDALEKLKKKFSVIKITEEMVVAINIRED